MNKKFNIFSPLVLCGITLVLGACTFTSPGSTPKPPVNAKLVVDSMPSKTSYTVGELFDGYGLIIRSSEDNRRIEDYTLTPADRYQFSENDIGTFTFTVSRESFESTTFNVQVNAAFDELGLYKTTAKNNFESYYDNIDKSLYDESGLSSLLAIKNQYLNLIDQCNSKTEVDQTVLEGKQALNGVATLATIVGIEVAAAPTKVTYVVGESLDLTGMVVNAVYSNGGKAAITDYTVTAPNMNVANESVAVVISYQGFSVSFNIKIVERTVSGPQTIEIYATNDIHGQVEQQSGRASIGKVMTYMYNKGQNDNTLLLDQGDTWQGSIYSNYNHGEMITDLMNYVRYDARTVGNHDFDWGVSYLAYNTAKTYNGYKTPVLAANVYDFDFASKTIGSVQQSNIGVETITYTLENGLKVGIVGIIGKDQITSISSNFTTNIAFKDHIPIIKAEATKLRNAGCDIVISCNHCDQDDLRGEGLEEYVDLALCAHSHQFEYDYYETNNDGEKVYYAQFKSYNEYIGHITLTYDPSTKKITNTSIDPIEASTINSQVSMVETNINNIINTYNAECQEAAEVVVANNVSGSFYSSGALPNLMCKAIYDTAVSEGYTDITLAYVNNARASLYSGSWDYSNLYQAFPFDNTVYIIEASYDEMMNEVGGHNFVYRSPNFDGTVRSGQTYKIACLDYLMYHTNSSRYYDYFPNNNGRYIGALSDNYRVILRNWLIKNKYNSGNKTLSSDDYSSSLVSFSRDFTAA